MGAMASQIASLTIVYFNRLLTRKSKKTSKLRVTGPCVGNSPVNSPHKWPVTRKMFPFDDVIMVFGNDGIVPFYCTCQVISPLRDVEPSLLVYFWNSQIDIVNTS